MALPLYRHVLTLDPSNATARLELARAETENGNFQQSLELARPVLSALKNSPDGLFVLAIDYLKTKDQDAAVSLASDWLRLSDIPPDLSMKFALVFAREGVASQAIDLLNAIRKKGPPSYELAFNLAGAYQLEERWALALASYDEALTFESYGASRVATGCEYCGAARTTRACARLLDEGKEDRTDNPDILEGFAELA